MKRILLICSILLLSGLARGQTSMEFRQFSFQPYLYNPAYAAQEGKVELRVAHRQQWIGFEGAPTTSGFTFQLPLPKAAFGLNLSTQQAGALRTTFATWTFSYSVKMTKSQTLSFGLGTGVQFRQLDLEGYDYTNDPAIMDATQNVVHPVGSFGLLYTFPFLKAGIVLPTLVKDQNNGNGILRTRPFTPLLNQFYSLEGIIKTPSGNFEVRPFLTYRQQRDLQDYWEGGVTFHIRKVVSPGLSFHTSRGAAFLLGISLSEAIRINYSFETPVQQVDFAGSNSHEFQLALLLKKNGKQNTNPSTVPKRKSAK